MPFNSATMDHICVPICHGCLNSVFLTATTGFKLVTEQDYEPALQGVNSILGKPFGSKVDQMLRRKTVIAIVWILLNLMRINLQDLLKNRMKAK